MCIAEGTACVEKFEYFLIESQKGVGGYAGLTEPVDGILGMSRDEAPEEYNYTVGPLFVKHLKDADITEFNVFSFYLVGIDETSFIDFSGYDKANMRGEDDSNITWLQLNDDFYWSQYCQGVAFGVPGKTNAYTFGIGKGVFTIFDTGTSFTLVPASFWEGFTATLAVTFGIK